MKTMKVFYALTIALLCLQAQAQQIIGYAPYYRTYSNFDFTKYTHVHFFAIWPEADGSFNFPQSEDSLSFKTKYDKIAQLAQPEGVKMVMTFGGTDVNGSKYFETLSVNETTRKHFVAQAIKLCKEWKIDGIDIDWEGLRGEEANQGYIDLMTELREACTDNNLTLSTDIPASSWGGQHYDANAIQLADYINVMSYTYGGAWAKTADHHTQLDKVDNIGLAYWENQGIPKSKLNLGSAFYGHKYEGTTVRGGSFTKVSDLTYPQIENLISTGYTVVEDNENGTYCYSEEENAIVFYDSPKNVTNKMNFAIDNGYSGVIIWEIGQDDSEQTLATALVDAKNKITSIKSNEEKKVDFILQNKILNIQSEEQTQIKIYNTTGTLLLTSSQKEVNLSHLNHNVYILVIESNTAITRERIFIF